MTTQNTHNKNDEARAADALNDRAVCALLTAFDAQGADGAIGPLEAVALLAFHEERDGEAGEANAIAREWRDAYEEHRVDCAGADSAASFGAFLEEALGAL